MSIILLDEKRARNIEPEPIWFVLHGGEGAQRRRWGPDMKRIADELIKYGWVVYREGFDVVAKHRCMIGEA